jgi:phosphatidylglycerophosphate synthase
MGELGARPTGLNPTDLAAGWSALHHGLDPGQVPLLRPWLGLVWRVARPLRWVPPIMLTALGAVFALGALLLAASQPWVALGLVIVATACDALDGAVALLSGRATRSGAMADKVADRIADSAFALVIWQCGAPLWSAVVAAVLSLLHEAVREVRGGPLRVRITVAERPTRVICAALACVCSAVSSLAWPPTVCVAVWIGLAAIGLVQLGRA